MGLNSVVGDMVTYKPGCISSERDSGAEIEILVHRTQGGCGMASPETWRGSQQLLEKAPYLVVADGTRGLGGTRETPTHPHPIQIATGFHEPIARARKSHSSFLSLEPCILLLAT